MPRAWVTGPEPVRSSFHKTRRNADGGEETHTIEPLPVRVAPASSAALAHTADRDVEDTIARADRGLYMAKNTGRNRCVYMPMSERPDDRQAA